MTLKSQRKQGHDRSQETQELKDLLQAAQEQPGIREVMEVYQYYQTIEQVARLYTQAIATNRIVYLSDGTNSASIKE